MASNAKILVGNDCGVVLQNYTLLTTGALVTDATMTFTVYTDDRTGLLPTGPMTLTVMPGLSAISMTYYSQPQSYIGLIPGTVLLTPFDWFWIKIAVSNYSDVFSDWFQTTVRTSGSG